MRVVFMSNFYNHHQSALCRVLASQLEGGFTFVASSDMPPEQKLLGYPLLQDDFVISVRESTSSAAQARRAIESADLVIMGGLYGSVLRSRMSQGRATFLYTERLLKRRSRALDPRLAFSVVGNHSRYRRGPLYLLAAGAYVAGDFRIFGAYREKALKWGYFPEPILTSDLQRQWRRNAESTARILWVGRLVDWKRPLAAIKVATYLRELGYRFRLEFVGTGPLERELGAEVEARGLEPWVDLAGAMPAERVRQRYCESDIFMFTSGRREGWGAVLNEAMSAGCAVVANAAAGSVPFLVSHGVDGLAFRSNSVSSLGRTVADLLDDPELCHDLGSAAIDTIDTTWSPAIAGSRLLRSAEIVLDGGYPDFASGPCSPA